MAKQTKSAQDLVLVKEIKDGVVVTEEGKYVKILEITPINFHMRSIKERNLIIQSFASWLKIAPAKIQFKVLSFPADINNHITGLKEDIEKEENERCKELQEDYLSLICNVGLREGVTRRFFIIFEHEPKATFGNDFETAVSDLNSCVQTVRNFLKQCGNKVIEHEDEDYFLCELFYSIYNRTKIQSLRQRLNSVINEYDKEGIEGEVDMKDLISPLYVNCEPSIIQVDDTFFSYFYIPSSDYRTMVSAGWLSSVINSGEGVDVDIFLKKADKFKVRKEVGRQLRVNKANIKDSSDTNTDFDDLSDAISAGYYIKQALAENQDLYYLNTLITVSGPSPEAVQYKVDFLEDLFNSQDMSIQECKYHELDAFQMALPLCRIEKTIYERGKRNILTEGAASMYPFTSFEISDDNGILFGINQQNNSLCIIDLFNTEKYKNANVSILGTSGAGKTFLLQTMALRMRMRDIQTFIIAPLKGHEFKRACNSIGGEYIKISPGSVNSINILEIRPQDKSNEILLDYDDEDYNFSNSDSILAKKLESLRAFFSLIIPDMSYEEKQLVDNGLSETYRRKGITHDNNSLLDKKANDEKQRRVAEICKRENRQPASEERLQVYKKMPILGDLLKVLKEMADDRTRRVELILERYVNGSAASFNRQTNVNLNNKYVVVDISEFSEELQPVGMFVALDFIYDKVKEDRTKKKAVFIDEAWKLIGAKSNALAANFVLEIFKIIRGYGGSAICATQDINDFFALEGGKFGKGIISNSKTKIILQLESQEAETVRDIFELSDREMTDIIRFERGTGLVITNSNNVPIKIVASDKEKDLITTDRKRLEELAREKEGQSE